MTGRVPTVLHRRLAGAILLIALAAGGCSLPKDPILVDEGHVTVENLTSVEWRSVRVTVNDHFVGGVTSLLPGGRLNAPLSQFQTALGQKFDRSRQSVFKVEVSATDASGAPVSLKWGTDRPK